MSIKNTLKEWLTAATPAEIEKLWVGARTSREYLYQAARGDRQLSAGKAGVVVDTANAIRALRTTMLSQAALPVLRRSDVCDACHMCPHAALPVSDEQ